MYSRTIFTLSSLLGLALAHPAAELLRRDPSATANAPAAVATINNNDGVGAGSNSFKSYSGDGSTGAGWPSKDQWVSFEDMFNNHKGGLSGSCSQFGVPNNSADEINSLYNGIQQIAQASKVDHRFIFAVILQESSGCVRVPTTAAPGASPPIYNPGLMQDHDGFYTCNCQNYDEYNQGCGVVNPCPANTITQMIREGAQGTNAGDGLASLINQAQSQGATGAQTFYIAAQWYNRGAGSPPVGGSLSTYAVDIANYLTGWQN